MRSGVLDLLTGDRQSATGDKMLYINMGHNIIDYANKTNKELSFTFENETQNKLIIDGLFWLGSK
jgi:uncharacterized protein